MSTNNVLSLLPDIYNSAVDSTTWGSTLDKITAAVGGKAALVIVVDQKNQSELQINHFSRLWSEAPDIVGLYNEKYLHYEQDGWNQMFNAPKQSIFLDNEVWADVPDLLNRPDYKFIREKVGITRRLAARLNDNMSWWDSITIHLDEKYETIPDTTIVATRQLLAHIAKSIELSRTFDILHQHYNAVLTVLDHVQIGLCIVQRNGEIVVKNTEARRLLEERDGIRQSADGKITSVVSEQDARLKQAIEKASDTAMGEDTAHELFLVNDRQSQATGLLIEVSPLQDHSQELGPNLSGAMVTLIDPHNTRPFSVSRTVAAYDLTSSEAEVCRLLVDGYSTTNMADIRSVSPETIKTQVKTVLRKTRCARRSDLIRLALKTSPPVVVPTDKLAG